MKMLLGGEWVDRDKRIEVRDPFDNSLIDTVPRATAADVETALAAAVKRLKDPRSFYVRNLLMLIRRAGTPDVLP